MLLTYAAHHMQHRHKACAPMHLKLTQVVSAITGVTGMAILKAIIAGRARPTAPGAAAQPALPHAEDDIAQALQGTWRAEHLCA